MTRSNLSRLLILAVGLLALPHSSHAQEWPRFRGPDGSGISTSKNLPSTFTEKDFNWNLTLPAGGHSSPVLWGEKIFVTCATEDGSKGILLCVNAVDGKVLWTSETPLHTYHKHADNSYASSSPAADADHVYFGFPTSDQFTLQALTHDGKPAWKFELGPFVAEHGGGQSPIVVDGTVIVSDDQDRDSFIIGLDAKTGTVKWKTPRKTDKFSASTPCVFHPAGDGSHPQVIFTAKSHGMTALDPVDGKVLWEISGAWDSRTVGSPTVGAGLAFATCGEGQGGHYLLGVKPGQGAETAKVAFKTKEKTPYVPSPIAVKDLLFFWSDGGFVTCAKAATGEQLWQERVGGAGGFYSSPVYADGKLFNVSKQGEVVVIAAKEKFEKLGSSKLGTNEKCHATPAIGEGKIYFRSYTHLISVGKGAGNQ